MEPDEVRALLEAVRSRGEIKRLGARVDREPALRAAALALAAADNIPVDEGWTGKRLVRALRDRSGAAQVRKNPIHIDESFVCVWCGIDVPPGGARVRDHCPRCLRSLHVDVVPGDRAAGCGGLLDPVRLELDHGTVVIRYRCRTCGHETRTKSHPDDAIPPSLSIADLP